jgi:hypothetical protein
MGRQIVLLAGLHKTATSSIQATCVANVERLREAGWVYPLRLGGKDDRGNHSAVMVALFRQEPLKVGLLRQLDVGQDDEDLSGVKRFRETAVRRLEGAPDINLLMVAEAASTLTRSEMLQMKEWFVQRGWKMRVMCHVRHVSSWLHSMVAQRVNGQMRMSIGAAVDEFRQAGGLVRPRLENLRTVFPDLEVYSHEAAVGHGRGPAGFMLKQLGVRVGAGWPVVRANEGRGDCATRFLSLLNEEFGLADGTGRLNPRFLHLKELRGGIQLPGDKFRLRAHEAAALADMLRDENEWLRREFGEAFCDPRIALDDEPVRWRDEALAGMGQALRKLPTDAQDRILLQAGRLGLDPQVVAGLMAAHP